MSKGRRKKRKRHRKNRKESQIQRARRRFTEKALASPALANRKVRLAGPTDVKVSDLLWEVAQPLIEEVDSDEAAKRAIDLAAFAWNLSLHPTHKHEAKIEKLVKEMSLADREWDAMTRKIVATLVKRKLALCPDVRRLIAHYELVCTSDMRHLRVASIPLGEGP